LIVGSYYIFIRTGSATSGDLILDTLVSNNYLDLPPLQNSLYYFIGIKAYNNIDYCGHNISKIIVPSDELTLSVSETQVVPPSCFDSQDGSISIN